MPQIEIHIKGCIDPGMSDWFQDASIEPVSPHESRIVCEAIDQSAIYGILSTLSSLGLPLISVTVTDHDGVRFISSSPDLE
jgi:hypothetical protein